MVTLKMVQEAQEALKGIARKTPLENANRLGENIYIKSENLQLTGAFKIRGAYNKIRSLTPEEASHGVIACSAGNHAQGIALSATKLGIKSVICMPEGAPISKVEATRSYGAEVVLVPGIYDDAAREAERFPRSTATPSRIPSMILMSSLVRAPSASRFSSSSRKWSRSWSPSAAAV